MKIELFFLSFLLCAGKAQQKAQQWKHSGVQGFLGIYWNKGLVGSRHERLCILSFTFSFIFLPSPSFFLHLMSLLVFVFLFYKLSNFLWIFSSNNSPNILWTPSVHKVLWDMWPNIGVGHFTAKKDSPQPHQQSKKEWEVSEVSADTSTDSLNLGKNNAFLPEHTGIY